MLVLHVGVILFSEGKYKLAWERTPDMFGKQVPVCWAAKEEGELH